MPPLNQALSIYQSGRETTPGTAVPATSKLAVENLSINLVDELVRPKLVKGLAVANPGNELAVHRGVEWEVSSTPLVYDQFQQLLAMAVVGGVAPSGVGPYTWTYTRDPTALDALDSRTFEARLTDGATPIDWEFAYGMCTMLEVAGAINEPLRFTARGFGRRLQTSTLTAAQALPAIAIPAVALSTVRIDGTWAGRGTTPISGQVLGWRFGIETGERPIMATDGRTDLDFSLDVIDANEVKLSLELVILATAGGQWETEKTAAEAGTLRAVEVRAVAGDDSLKLQGLFKHTPGSIFPNDFQEGQRIITLALEGATDETNFLAAEVVNGAATLG